jgi:hypothetical protein
MNNLQHMDIDGYLEGTKNMDNIVFASVISWN